MAAAQPTIIATSIGFAAAQGSQFKLRAGPAYRMAARLARAGAHPRICLIGTAGGDNPAWAAAILQAFAELDMLASYLALFPMPNVDDVEAHLRKQDVIWVGGGSTANLLAVWRVHGLERILRDAWQAGVVLMGTSAGAICWHSGGTTDSFGAPLRPITDGLGLLPYSNCPHYDAEPERRPLYQRLVADGTLPDGYATDNGSGLVYFGTDVHEAFSESAGPSVWSVRRDSDGSGVVETALATRVLGRGG